MGSSQEIYMMEEMEQLEVESEGPKQEEKEENPNRKVKHTNREIDTMVNSLIQDRRVIAQSIANYIYHSLMRDNAISDSEETEEKEDCPKNLTKQFEKKR